MNWCNCCWIVAAMLLYELIDACCYEYCYFNSIDELYIYYCYLWISPLLLENVALRMGNLQVLKTSRTSGSSVLGLWYVTGWGKRCFFFHSFMYQILKHDCWSFRLLNNILYCWGLCAKILLEVDINLKRIFRCSLRNDMLLKLNSFIFYLRIFEKQCNAPFVDLLWLNCLNITLLGERGVTRGKDIPLVKVWLGSWRVRCKSLIRSCLLELIFRGRNSLSWVEL